MNDSRRSAAFWDEHWWKPLIWLGVAAGLTAAGFGLHTAQANTRDENETCWERGGQIHEGLCISSPVRKEAS